jgi:hypothetical protein
MVMIKITNNRTSNVEVPEAAAVFIALGTVMIRYGCGPVTAWCGSHYGDLVQRIVEEGIDGKRAEELLQLELEAFLEEE